MALITPFKPHPGYITGNTYNMWVGAAASAAVPAADTIYLFPFPIYAPVTITSIVQRVITGGAGSAVKAAIWGNSLVSNKPLGAPIVADNTGVATTSSSSNATHDVIDTKFAPGWYWFGSKFQATLPSMLAMSANAGYSGFFFGGSSTSTLIICGFSYADAYSNNMPTLAEGATFTNVTVSGIPLASFTL